MSCNVFITGGGTRLGKDIVERFLSDNASIDTLTSNKQTVEKVNSAYIDWSNANYDNTTQALANFKNGETYDYVIFNHNAGSIYGYTSYGNVTKGQHEIWSRTYFINCQLVEICINKLKNRINKDTKIITLISGIIERKSEVSDKNSGYCGMKSALYYMTAGFKEYLEGQFICINPGHFETDEQIHSTGEKFYKLIETIDYKDLYYNLHGTPIDVTYKARE